MALTRAVWEDCVVWGPEDTKAPQDEAGRLWDVLFMAARAAARHRHSSRFPFIIVRVPRTGKAVRPQLVNLVCRIGPGDDAEPVITIMQPGED